MPPFVPRKRLASTPPPPSTTPAKKAKLSDLLDADPHHFAGPRKPEAFSLGSDESDSSLSAVDSDAFEDVPAALRDTVLPNPAGDDDEDDEDDEDEIEWEDAGAKNHIGGLSNAPLADGPIELVFRKDDTEIDYDRPGNASQKKGPTKREKEVRVRTHKMHVQFLLWHNAIRNRWIADREVQQTLVSQLPPQIRKEVDRWRRASGLPVAPDKPNGEPVRQKEKISKKDPRSERDWGRPSERLEAGKADMSRGDPLIHLMNVLAAYWKKRFAITAPGLRKRGYGAKQALKQIIYSFRNDEHDPEEHGERVRDVDEFRELAKKAQGSRDVGAQLFTALLRGLGIEARMVASLQPSGFGWTKAEQSLGPRKSAKAVELDSSSDESDDPDESLSISEITSAKPPRRANATHRTDGKRAIPHGSKSVASDNGNPVNDAGGGEDDESVVDVTPSRRKPTQKYDRDNPFPIYWTEVISPITNKALPTSPLTLGSPVASTPEILSSFEPRGARAERTKTVMAYVVAYSSDGTAKDVTVRYLKKRIWPGKTKGFRIAVEKIPIYNKHGKVKRYEEEDWFKRIMCGYERPHVLRTAVDDVEESFDLVPQIPEKKSVNEEVDTLQSLKSSADYVLQRFLRREEALRPGAEPDRMFVSGKAGQLKEEPVYRRSDVERCLTAESWHKEGRRPKAGQVPLKLVPVRAVTLTRKREAEEHERQTGQKQMQGLYSWDQTEYIIPPPIRNGVIPKNAYGNIDCFVPSMIPRGAVHLPYKGTVRVCKKLDIDFAEAVTGFEFGNKRAVPVCEGVVVATENQQAVLDALRKFNEEQRKKEETKMEKLVLDLWRKFLMGLRIRERVQDTYGDVQPVGLRGTDQQHPITLSDDNDDDEGDDIVRGAAPEDDFGGGFLLDDDDEEDAIPEDLEIVHQDDLHPSRGTTDTSHGAAAYITPSSASHLASAAAPRRTLSGDEVEDDDSDQDTPASFEEDGASIDVAERIKRRHQPTATIEVHIPTRRRRPGRKLATPQSTPSDGSPEADDDSSDDPSSDNGESDSQDEYNPGRGSKWKAKNEVSEIFTSVAPRRTRAAGSLRDLATPLTPNAEGAGAESVTPHSNRSRRAGQKGRAVVTSPYF